MKHRIGDKVLIVDHRTKNMNPSGQMDKYFHKIMTIIDYEQASFGDCYRMKEDCKDFYGRSWFWDDEMLESVVDI